MNRVVLVGLSMLWLGCAGVEDDVAEDTDLGAGEPAQSPGAALLLLSVAPEPLCNTVGVTEVRLQVRRVGCVSGPCTVPADPPAIVGDGFTCPNTDPSTLLGIEVDRSGRYTVQTVIEFTTGDTETRCHAESGASEIAVTNEDVEMGVVRRLDAGSVSCS